MTIRAGAHLDATDFTLPDPVIATAGGAGTNTIAATAWAVLPTNTCTAVITNPHPELAMLVDVRYGAWLVGSGSGADVRAGLDVSGSLALPPGVGAGGASGWGEVLHSSGTSSVQCSGGFTIELPVSTTAASFKVHAYKSSGTGQQVNYPTIRLIPLRFVS